MKLGLRSSVNGLNPLKLEPDFFNCTKSPITSSKRAVSYTLSMVDFEINLYIFKQAKDSTLGAVEKRKSHAYNININ
tara:strand:+ start:11902 stop:12132 length:231 start_codon:yes stop_codon:yes gene_type:complete